MKKTTKTKVLFLMCTLPFFFLTSKGFGKNPEVNIGVILPLSGRLAKFGEIEKKSLIMGIEELNRSQKRAQYRWNLIIKDSKGNPKAASQAAEKMINEDGVVTITGGCSSSVAWEISEIAEKYHVPFLISTASADKITGHRRKFTFRIAPPASSHGNALSSFLKQTNCINSAAVIYQEPSWSSMSIRMSNQLRSTGIRLALRKGFKVDAEDYRDLVQTVKEKMPELIYIMAPPSEAARLITTFQVSPPYPKLFIWRSAGSILPEFRRKAGPASEYVVSSSLWAPTVPYAGAKRYYNQFRARYTFAPEYHGAQAYAAMEVITEALMRVNAPEPEQLRDALARTDIMTVFGPVKFVSYGRMSQQNRVPALLVQWLGGVLETIWPKQLASREYTCPYPH